MSKNEIYVLLFNCDLYLYFLELDTLNKYFLHVSCVPGPMLALGTPWWTRHTATTLYIRDLESTGTQLRKEFTI
jgi:hypothetical protein